MTILSIAIGIGVPALNGWLALRVLEGAHPVLARWERWAIGAILGATLTVFIQFLLLWSGIIGVNTAGLLMSSGGTTLVLGIVWLWQCKGLKGISIALPASAPLPVWGRWLAGIAAVWIVLKLCTGGFLLIMSPPYYDDVINNWNFRAKTLLHRNALTLTLDRGYGVVDTNTVTSYPPSIPLIKANMTILMGRWSEGLVNLPHIVWYALALVILFWQLRWRLSLGWGLVGTYLLSSIPLYLLHGSVAYADLFLSIHVLIAVSLCYRALIAADGAHARSLLLIAALSAGLTAFTKNEGTVLLFPLLAACIAVVTIWRMRNDPRAIKTLLLCAALCAALVLPWIAYKWMNGLGFGNAKDVSGLDIGWQKGVVGALLRNSFLTGGWLLFFPCLIALLVVHWRNALRTPLVLITGFLLCTYGLQAMIYLFTSLSVEAIYQTGYGRGVVQLLPTACLLATVLLHEAKRTLVDRHTNA
jgi:hypothetical protein